MSEKSNDTVPVGKAPTEHYTALFIARLQKAQTLTAGTDQPILPISLREHGIRAGAVS